MKKSLCNLVKTNHYFQQSRLLKSSTNNCKSFRDKYRDFWTPKATEPPYLHVVQVGDPVLRCKCDPVPQEMIGGPEVKLLINIMTDMMAKFKCVGLAAPQIGVPLRVIGLEFKAAYKTDFGPTVYKTRSMETLPLTVLVNPELKVTDYEKRVFPETCASVVGYSAEVPRHLGVELKGFDAHGKMQSLQLSGWNARIAQHEMDHIDGVVFTDVMDRKSLKCDCWEAVNKHSGRIRLTFSGSK